MILSKRTAPLTVKEIDEFFDPSTQGHLKYRITMLQSYKDRRAADAKVPYQDSICGFESALVACRLFMQFLGLSISHNPNLQLIENPTYFNSGGKSDEVKVTDLGGSFVSIASDFTPTEADLLARTYHAASKATAHLTAGSNHGFKPEELSQSVDLVTKLLQKRLYGPVGRPIERHFD